MILGMMLSPLATSITTRHLASAFHRYAPEGVAIDELSLADVPLQPPYEDMPIPMAGSAWKQRVQEVDGLVVVVRARTRSVPGHLKIGIDWASQPDHVNALRGKPCVVIAVGEGTRPSFLALQHARTVLTDAGANVAKRPDHALVITPQSFTPEGLVEDPDLAETITDLLASTAGFCSHEQRVSSLELSVAPIPLASTAALTNRPAGPVL